MKKTNSTIRIVAIGASAGGLEALQQFFKGLPLNTGLSYVVIQHLSPDYKSLMDELLSRYTDMPIIVIKDGIQIEPNHVYLIPPRNNLKVFKDRLFLTKQDSGTALNLPIDHFFRSLADEKSKDAIGVVLSGTGSDGTLGTRAIKEVNGTILVQDEKTAKFNGMPSSAISTGLVDYILPPDKMGSELMNFIKHPLLNNLSTSSPETLKNISSLTKVILMLRDYSGIDFSFYKEKTIHRRLERRISINRFHSLEEYLPFLSDSNDEKEILYREFLIGVTRFFRDKEAFNALKKKALPHLFKQNKNNLRIWTTGCSTGEEAYSIGILMLELAEQYNYRGDIKIFATDIDRRSIETAGAGCYPDNIAADVDPLLLKKYFHKLENGYKINEDLRNLIVFAPHNVLKDPPFSKLDLLVCRNLFIYLKPEIQANLLSRFYYSLNAKGFLFMGNSETLGGMSDAFDVVDLKNNIYSYKVGHKPKFPEDLSVARLNTNGRANEQNGRQRQDNGQKNNALLTQIVNTFSPPSIIVDSHYTIVKVINNVNSFTEIQEGNYSGELFSILPKDIGLYVNNMLRQIKNKNIDFLERSIVGLEKSRKEGIKIELRQIPTEGQLLYMLSFFRIENNNTKIDSTSSPSVHSINKEQNDRIIELEKELNTTKENLAATVEELESANEELQSSNEELIASNEELQSTNEELQSVNEELYTVNSEYQQKIEELTRLNNDINNLLKNTEIAAIYLDSQKCIRKITPEVSKITYILETDIGRPVSHLKVMDNYTDIVSDINSVIENLQPIDKEILNKEGKPYFARLRPYRTENNAVDGVIITIVDVSELKKLQSEIKKTYQRLDSSMDLGNMAWWEWDVNTGKVIYDDRKATMLGYSREEFPDNVMEICDLIHPDDYKSTMDEMKKVLDGKTDKWEADYRMKKNDGSYIWFRDQGSIKSYDRNGKPALLIGMVINVSDYHILEEDFKKNQELLNLIVENSPAAITMVNTEGWITFANKEAEHLFDITKEQILQKSYDASEWEITDEKGNEILKDQLPFSIISKTKKPVKNFKHYIRTRKTAKVLLSIDGSPVFSGNTQFEGAVFIIKAFNNEAANN